MAFNNRGAQRIRKVRAAGVARGLIDAADLLCLAAEMRLELSDRQICASLCGGLAAGIPCACLVAADDARSSGIVTSATM
jgi:hypothetical protein